MTYMCIAKIQATVHIWMHVKSYVMTKHNRKLRPDMEGSSVRLACTLTISIGQLCWHNIGHIVGDAKA